MLPRWFLPLNPETDSKLPFLLCPEDSVYSTPVSTRLPTFPIRFFGRWVFSYYLFIFSLTRLTFAVNVKVQFIFGVSMYWFVSVFLNVSVFSISKSNSSWSSNSPSSLSDSVSVFQKRFCIVFSFPFSMSLKIAFHWMYFPSIPRGIANISSYFVAVLRGPIFLWLWIVIGGKICFQRINIPSSVVSVSLPLTTACIFILNFPFIIFSWLFSTNSLTKRFFLSFLHRFLIGLRTLPEYLAITMVLTITREFDMSPRLSLVTNIGRFDFFTAETGILHPSDSYDLQSSISLLNSVLDVLPW